MTVTHGADVEALRRLAEEMLTHAEVCLRAALRTTAALEALSWSGRDADRARGAWSGTHEPHLRETSRLVAEAARHVIDEARQQEAASAATGDGGVGVAAGAVGGGAGAAGAPGAPGAPGAGQGSRWQGLLDQAAALAGVTASSHDLARVLGVVAQEGRTVSRAGFEAASGALDAFSPAVRQVGQLASAYGVLADGYGLVRGAQEGDYSQVVGSLGGLGFAAAGGLGVAGAGPLGAAWGVGHAAGTAMYEGMQGTTYGDIVRDMSEGAFDQNGFLGVFQVPGILGFAAWERWGSGPRDGG